MVLENVRCKGRAKDEGYIPLARSLIHSFVGVAEHDNAPDLASRLCQRWATRPALSSREAPSEPRQSAYLSHTRASTTPSTHLL